MKIKKVIIPAAGFGTRFLPQTKAMPKEMLPVVDKPVIQYVVEDAVSAGIEDVIIVTGANKRAIEDHFDMPNQDLVNNLLMGKKENLLEDIKKISDLANFIYIRQKGPYGNATPIKCAKHVLYGEPFMVLWGDDFVSADPSRAQQMVSAFEKYQAPILCCIETEKDEDANRYGFVEGEDLGNGIWKVNRLIEKPGVGKAPSKIANVSGYILTPDIWEILESQKAGKGGEYYLAEALDEYVKTKPIYACVIQNGKYHDTGNKFEYMKTVIEFALKNEEFGEDLKKFLESLDY